jgi:uncharacterized metal-binding protein
MNIYKENFFIRATDFLLLKRLIMTCHFLIGFVYGAYALGPALGFLLGSVSLSKWVNPLEEAPLNISET